MFYLVIVAIIFIVLFKILNVNNSAEKSIFYCKNQKFLDEFLKRAPELELPYVPTRFWGFSGHIQTIIQVSIRRFRQAAHLCRMGGKGQCEGKERSESCIWEHPWLGW